MMRLHCPVREAQASSSESQLASALNDAHKALDRALKIVPIRVSSNVTTMIDALLTKAQKIQSGVTAR